VLLQNGNVLRGQVQDSGDRITIVDDGNSRLTMDRKQIECVGPSLDSLYLHQRAGVRVWGTGEHWHLAHWCIQHGLLDRAIEHFAFLEIHANDTPRFKQLEHLLREALIKHQKSRQPSLQPATETATVASDQAVVQSSNEPPVVPASHAASTDVVQNGEGWSSHEIPGYIRKSFHTTVLPVLVLRCGQSGCHGLLGKSDFHIYQPVGDQAASIRAKDLESVLKYVYRDRVQDSPLLAYATRAHGIQRNPSLNPVRDDERAHIERISAWIKSLALSQRPETTMPNSYPLAHESTNITQANAPSAVQRASANVALGGSDAVTLKDLLRNDEPRDRQAKLSKPAKTASPPVLVTGSELADLETMIERLEKKYNGTDPSAVEAKKDPFDPELFNKKYR
jgi:hypothetical protein